MTNNNFKSNMNAYVPFVENLSLSEHYARYPDHPWNRWLLDDRDDWNDWKKYDIVETSTQFVKNFGNSNKVEKYWFKANRSVYHRFNAPASIVFENDKIVKENWFINGDFHRVDGPAVRGTHATWCLFGLQLVEKNHKEIVDIYNELGDWLLAFSLSSIEKYNEEALIRRINQFVMGK